MDAKEEINELRLEIASWVEIESYWQEKATAAEEAIADARQHIAILQEKLAAELSQVSA